MLKLQILFVGVSVGVSLIVTYFFGFMIGSVLNIVMLFGIIYYIRRKQTTKEFGSFSSSLFGFSDKSPSSSSPPSSSSSRISNNSSIINTDRSIKYVCLTCSTKVTGRTCRKCGSHMKKPVF